MHFCTLPSSEVYPEVTLEVLLIEGPLSIAVSKGAWQEGVGFESRSAARVSRIYKTKGKVQPPGVRSVSTLLCSGGLSQFASTPRLLDRRQHCADPLLCVLFDVSFLLSASSKHV